MRCWNFQEMRSGNLHTSMRVRRSLSTTWRKIKLLSGFLSITICLGVSSARKSFERSLNALACSTFHSPTTSSAKSPTVRSRLSASLPTCSFLQFNSSTWTSAIIKSTLRLYTASVSACPCLEALNTSQSKAAQSVSLAYVS